MKRAWMSFKIIFLGATLTFLLGFETAWTSSSNTCAQLYPACKRGLPDGSNKDKCYCIGSSGCLIFNGDSGCGHCYNSPGAEEEQPVN